MWDVLYNVCVTLSISHPCQRIALYLAFFSCDDNFPLISRLQHRLCWMMSSRNDLRLFLGLLMQHDIIIQWGVTIRDDQTRFSLAGIWFLCPLLVCFWFWLDTMFNTRSFILIVLTPSLTKAFIFGPPLLDDKSRSVGFNLTGVTGKDLLLVWDEIMNILQDYPLITSGWQTFTSLLSKTMLRMSTLTSLRPMW